MILPSFVVTTITLLGLFSPFNSNGEREEKVRIFLNLGFIHIFLGHSWINKFADNDSYASAC